MYKNQSTTATNPFYDLSGGIAHHQCCAAVGIQIQHQPSRMVKTTRNNNTTKPTTATASIILAALVISLITSSVMGFVQFQDFPSFNPFLSSLSFPSSGSSFGEMMASSSVFQFAVAQTTTTDAPVETTTTTTVSPSGAASATNTFTFGYLRMGIDTPSIAAGLLAGMKKADSSSTTTTFRLNVTTIPCLTAAACRSLSTAHQAILNDFLARMPYFTAVFRPNAYIALQIVDEAKRIGGMPVINPDDLRAETFTSAHTNVINFRQSWSQQAAHLFTFMQQNSRCAMSGIVYGRISNKVDAEYQRLIRTIQSIFTAGEYPSPPSLEAQTASDADFFNFFLGRQHYRRCFIVLGTASLMQEVMTRLMTNSTFASRSAFFYGTSMMMGDTYRSNASLYRQTYLSHWIPPYDTENIEWYTSWHSNRLPADDAIIHPAEGLTYPSSVTISAEESYMMVTLTTDVVRDALSELEGDSLSSNTTAAWAAVIDAFYRDARTFDRHPFNLLVRACPRPPAEQICFCNTLAADSYIYRIDNVTGQPAMVFDDEDLGQKNMAHVHFPSQCGYTMSSWSYPITALAMFPDYLITDSNDRNDQVMVDAYNTFQEVFGIMTRETNFAPTPPTRALRYAAYDVADDTQLLQSSLNNYIDTLKPFVVYGSLTNPIRASRDTLTLLPMFLGIDMEDVPLTAPSEWQSNILQLTPTLADYIHALVGFSTTRLDVFTSFNAMATTQREAELISMSLATWGFDLPVSKIFISNSVDEWSAKINELIGDPNSAHPFVLVASTANDNSIIEAAAVTAAPLGRGTLAIACSIATAYSAQQLVNFSPSGEGDIVFGAFRREWWLANAYDGVPAELQQYVHMPRYHIAMLAIEFSRQLYSQVYFDYKKTAAEVLYSVSVVSAADTSFGPFYNTPCTAEEIAANTRDRRCQCTKGVHTFFVHSMRDYKDAVASTRTNQYSWTMTACGVIYTPYVPPVVVIDGRNSLAAGAIAGIAIGCSVFFILVLAYIIYMACFSGRDNRSAPKDPTLPFAIVFTDIQSSTALWARAPTAMSEAIENHHRLLRKAVRSNRGYEVKTVGDSFMVAFKRTEDAVEFSLDVQILLFEADWSSEIDATYVELLLEAEAAAQQQADDDDDNNTESISIAVTKDVATLSNAPPAAADVRSLHNTMELDGHSASYSAMMLQNKTTSNVNNNFNADHFNRNHSSVVSNVASSSAANNNNVSANRWEVPSFSNNNQNLNNLSTVGGNAVRSFNVSDTCSNQSMSYDGRGGGKSPNNAAKSPHSTTVKATFAVDIDDRNNAKKRNIHTNNGNIIVAALNNSHLAGHHQSNANNDDFSPLNRSAGDGKGPLIVLDSLIDTEELEDQNAHLYSPTAAAHNNAKNKQSSHNNHYHNTSAGGPLLSENDPNALSLKQMSASSSNEPYNNHNNNNLFLMNNKNNNNSTAANAAADIELSQRNHTVTSHLYTEVNNNNNNNNNNKSSSTAASQQQQHSARSSWHGLRVRIGIHYGHGDIRKDPISQGYDYYGTVVNTAARVEGVGHGGQILLTGAAYEAVGGNAFLRSVKSIVINLGPQPLRGLDEPIMLYQVVPERLQARRFPSLRLHIEKETEDDQSTLTDASLTNTTTHNSEAPEAIIARLCATRNYATVTPEDLTDRLHFMNSCFGPVSDKYRLSVITKLGEYWGFEKAAKEAAAGGGSKTRLMVNLMAKITKTFNSTADHQQNGGKHKARRGGGSAAPLQHHQTHNLSNVGGVSAYSSSQRTGGGGGGEYATASHSESGTHASEKRSGVAIGAVGDVSYPLR